MKISKTGNILSIETSLRELGVAVARVEMSSKRIIKSAVFFKSVSLRQSDLLVPTIKKLINRPGFGLPLEGVIVDVGPGSFTGVRVGVSTARALGQALQIPVIGVTSLEVKAFEACLNKKITAGCHIVVTRPALPEEVYMAVYRVEPNANLKTIIEPCWLSDETAKSKVSSLDKKRANPSSSTWGLARSTGVVVIDESTAPHPLALLRLGLKKMQEVAKKNLLNYERVQPLYLQPSWAERRTQRHVDQKQSA